MKQPLFLTGQYYLFLEQAEGYVKTPEKSTFRPSTIREVFEHCALGRGEEAEGRLEGSVYCTKW